MSIVNYLIKIKSTSPFHILFEAVYFITIHEVAVVPQPVLWEDYIVVIYQSWESVVVVV